MSRAEFEEEGRKICREGMALPTKQILLFDSDSDVVSALTIDVSMGGLLSVRRLSRFAH